MAVSMQLCLTGQYRKSEMVVNIEVKLKVSLLSIMLNPQKICVCTIMEVHYVKPELMCGLVKLTPYASSLF